MASMAAVPWREETLENVVNSLLPQVDRLNIYLNDWENVPSFLEHAKINAAFTNEIGDIGDRENFTGVRK